MKVLFCSSEVSPYAKTGGLGEVCGSLPLALERLGIEVSVVLPRYRAIDLKKFNAKRLDHHFYQTTMGKRIKVYFVENKNYFDREELYAYSDKEYPDNLERFQFFCDKALLLIKQFEQDVDLVHCHDWQTALIPMLLKVHFRHDPILRKVASLLTLHNLAYQGIFAKELYPKLGLPSRFLGVHGVEYFDQINLLKGGILFSDHVNTVSPTYAKEIQGELGYGLQGVLKSRENPVTGILNGIDFRYWNPEKDRFIARRFSASNPSAKVENKANLQKMLNLPVDANVPIFGFIGRLVSQKGLDLIHECLEEFMGLNVQLIFLGIGEEKYHRMLSRWQKSYPKNISIEIGFDEKRAHQIFAGADFFLMPSMFEPCGLSQMISLRYGTIPIVYKTGGLADSVQAIDRKRVKGNGFVFTEFKSDAFLHCVKDSLKLFSDAKDLKLFKRRAMRCDFSWDKSARAYKKLYQACLSSV